MKYPLVVINGADAQISWPVLLVSLACAFAFVGLVLWLERPRR